MNENMTRTLSYGVSGVKGFPVQVEVFSTGGIPGMEIIGLPDASVRESKDRVNAAIISSGKQMPPRRITVNLAPADMKKSGPLFDLPIAIGILSANGELHPAPVVDLTRTVIFGELSLDGYIQPVNGALPIVISASEAGLQDVILPAGNAREVSCIQGMHIYPVNHLREVIEHIEGKKTVQLQHQTEYEELKLQTVKKADLLQVKGQLGARRALEVAAAGGIEALQDIFLEDVILRPALFRLLIAAHQFDGGKAVKAQIVIDEIAVIEGAAVIVQKRARIAQRL